MKKITAVSLWMIFILVLCRSTALACPVCERQQPKVIRGISHGPLSGDKADYLIIAIAVFIVVISLILSLRYLINPGERGIEHIKRLILND